MRIGLLGGSFNPAHPGHLHVARTALRWLQLDQVWLLVSPGNPLKPAGGMAPIAERLAGAQALADGRRVLATDIERRLGTRYTVDTVRALRTRFPLVRFVWLMGADNLTQFPRWNGWRRIADAVPFAVLPRPRYTAAALAGRTAQALRRARLRGDRAPGLADAPPPAWLLLASRLHAESATAIRARRQPETSHRPQAP